MAVIGAKEVIGAKQIATITNLTIGANGKVNHTIKAAIKASE